MKTTSSFRLDDDDKRRLDLIRVAVQAEVDELGGRIPSEYHRRVTRSNALRYFLKRWEQGQPLPKPREGPP